MKTMMLVWTALLCACGPADDDLGPPRPGTSSSVGSTGVGGGAGGGETGGQGGQGGRGGGGGQAPCDPWDKTKDAPKCCAPESDCHEGVLGPCLVDVWLCNGKCAAQHVNPVPNTPCGTAGTCNDEGACVEPEPMGGAGGVGSGGNGDGS